MLDLLFRPTDNLTVIGIALVAFVLGQYLMRRKMRVLLDVLRDRNAIVNRMNVKLIGACRFYAGDPTWRPGKLRRHSLAFIDRGYIGRTAINGEDVDAAIAKVIRIAEEREVAAAAAVTPAPTSDGSSAVVNESLTTPEPATAIKTIETMLADVDAPRPTEIVPAVREHDELALTENAHYG